MRTWRVPRELPRRAASPLLAALFHAFAALVVYRAPVEPGRSTAPPARSSEPTIDVSFEAPPASSAPEPSPPAAAAVVATRIARLPAPATASPAERTVATPSEPG